MGRVTSHDLETDNQAANCTDNPNHPNHNPKNALIHPADQHPTPTPKNLGLHVHVHVVSIVHVVGYCMFFFVYNHKMVLLELSLFPVENPRGSNIPLEGQLKREIHIPPPIYLN